MINNNISATTTSLEDMLRNIDNGKTQLPDFQREWRWQDRQIKSLLASVSIGIPIGALLTLAGDEQLASRPFTGVNANISPADAKLLILDGQQRLTALYQACYSDQPVTTSSRKRVTEREYYFDIKICLDENRDREEGVSSETANGSSKEPTTQFENDLFPASQMFNYRQWRDNYLKHHDYEETKRKVADQFDDAVVRNFTRYYLPTIRMEDSDLETICITFEKTNDKGTRLNAFEIITAKMKREGFDLKDSWGKQGVAMATEPVLKRVEETHYLKAITLLATNTDQSRVSARRKDMLRLSREQYERYNTAITQGFTRAARQLREFGITKPGDLVHVPQAIVMAAVYASCGNQTETVVARDRFKRWYWTTLLNESYGGRVTDEQIAGDFIELVERMTNVGTPEPVVFAGSRFNSGRLFFEKQKSLTIAVQAMLAKEKRTRDWITGRPMEINEDSNSEMHHIFPRKWCDDKKINPALRESVANLTLIDSATNRIIGSGAPSEYLKKLQERAGNISDQVMDQILESHLIPARALRRDDFEGFHRERADNLKTMIANIIGPARIA